MELAKARYSVRKFSDKPIEKAKMDAILEAGRIAPTGHNYQPYRVYVLQSPEALEKIRGLTRCAFNAPVVLMVTVRKDEEWVNYFPVTKTADAFGLELNEVPLLLMPMGYAAEGVHAAHLHNERRSNEELVKVL